MFAAVDIMRILLLLLLGNQTPVDLPEQNQVVPLNETVSIVVTEDNKYYISTEGTKIVKDIEEIEVEIESIVADWSKVKLKILGHRKSEYAAIFDLIALCQKNGWDPILAHK